MDELLFLFNLLTSGVGFAAITVAFLLYVKHRKSAVLYYTLFLSAIGFEVWALTLNAIGSLAIGQNSRIATLLQSIAGVLEFLSIVTYPAIVTLFVHCLLGIALTRKRRLLLLSTSLLASVCYGIWRASGNDLFLYWGLLPLVYTASLYVLIQIFRHLGGIGDAILHKALKTFLLISGVYLPVYMLDSLSALIPGFPLENTYTLSLPVYFFLINSLGIYFAVRFFDRPAYLDQGRLTDHFTGKFAISAREAEIIAKLVTGLSNKEIGEQLHISFKTVENHLYSIYQKTGVRNRVQLASLLQTNRKEA